MGKYQPDRSLGMATSRVPARGVEVAVPATVATVGGITEAGATQAVGLSTHQGVDEHRQQTAQQIGAGAVSRSVKLSPW